METEIRGWRQEGAPVMIALVLRSQSRKETLFGVPNFSVAIAVGISVVGVIVNSAVW